MNKNHDGVSREARREQMAQLLARYPGLNSDELAELLHWFRKEASALDEGLISCDEKVSAAYRSFKKDHLGCLAASRPGVRQGMPRGVATSSVGEAFVAKGRQAC